MSQIQPVLLAQVAGNPEQVKPPNRVCQKLAEDESPGGFLGEELAIGDRYGWIGALAGLDIVAYSAFDRALNSDGFR